MACPACLIAFAGPDQGRGVPGLGADAPVCGDMCQKLVPFTVTAVVVYLGLRWLLPSVVGGSR